MANIAVVGCNWGDEGKGRMVDYFAKDAEAVIRFQGGNNAGHTVINEYGEFKLHLLPSGIFNSKALNVLGSGMVINIEALVAELSELILPFKPRLAISERATVCFPFHRKQDQLEEKRLGDAAFGSTQQGIAPAYADRNAKMAIQIGELKNRDRLFEKLSQIAVYKNKISQALYGEDLIPSVEAVIEWVDSFLPVLERFILNYQALTKCLENKNLVFEAQLGSLRDVNMGIYPLTTSSPVLSSYCAYGSGVPKLKVDEVVGITKAFSTCVGRGPFVTEMSDQVADTLREEANEFGATTARPRRIGHFDAVATRYGIALQDCDKVAITKLDCLSGQGTLKICTHYLLNGEKIDYFPINLELDLCEPVYIEMDTWEEDISGIRNWESLPEAAKKYVKKVEALIECDIRYVSVGPERDALILLS